MVILRIKAATLIETIVALTIIVFIFGMATSVFVGLTRGNMSVTQLRAEKKLDNYRLITNRDRLYFDERLQDEEFTIERLVAEYVKNNKLATVNYSIYNEQHELLGELVELVMKQ